VASTPTRRNADHDCASVGGAGQASPCRSGSGAGSRGSTPSNSAMARAVSRGSARGVPPAASAAESSSRSTGCRLATLAGPSASAAGDSPCGGRCRLATLTRLSAGANLRLSATTAGHRGGAARAGAARAQQDNHGSCQGSRPAEWLRRCRRAFIIYGHLRAPLASSDEARDVGLRECGLPSTRSCRSSWWRRRLRRGRGATGDGDRIGAWLYANCCMD